MSNEPEIVTTAREYLARASRIQEPDVVDLPRLIAASEIIHRYEASLQEPPCHAP